MQEIIINGYKIQIGITDNKIILEIPIEKNNLNPRLQINYEPEKKEKIKGTGDICHYCDHERCTPGCGCPDCTGEREYDEDGNQIYGYSC